MKIYVNQYKPVQKSIKNERHTSIVISRQTIYAW